MVKKYIPEQGDICFLDFAPTKGHEQTGYRPCLVISNNDFISFTKMAIVLPITSNTKEFPTHYQLMNTKNISGAVLCEHIRSIDYNDRELKYIEKLDDYELERILDLINSCNEQLKIH